MEKETIKALTKDFENRLRGFRAKTPIIISAK